MIANVVFGLPVDKVFSYSVPAGSQIKIGCRIKAPFRNSVRVGYVVGFSEKNKVDFDIKSITEILDGEPFLSGEILELTRWMSSYYYLSWGEAIEAALPGALRKGRMTSNPRQGYFFEKDKYFVRPSELTEHQKKSLSQINQNSGFNVFMLYGVTGSGKTEVYIRAIERVLAGGGSAAMLVPEIALTPQTVSRFISCLGDEISVFHSRLTEAQRFQEWLKLKEGINKVCIGTRSSIFAPLKNLKLIVIDEEHDSSYKQQDSPRYHARDVALKRAQICRCPVILGSATPSLESFYKAVSKKYYLLELPDRVEKKSMPDVGVVDLTTVKRRSSRSMVFSPALESELKDVLGRHMQAILFLNRRGFSTFVYCSKCGYVSKCPGCNVALTYHIKTKTLLCHYCSHKELVPEACPNCRGGYLNMRGIGTQRVESELHKIFPNSVRTARLDSDVLKKRGELERIIEAFKNKDIDVLIGTQIVAKGHDFPDVELVGVILADLSLNIIDFRADENTFSMLTQVAGRSGRGENRGKVIVQTYNPDHFAIQTSLNHDYKSFYAQEIEKRKQLGFPPFNDLIKMEFRHKDEKKVKQAAQRVKDKIASVSKGAYQVLGPAPHPVRKKNNVYRWNIIIKVKNIEQASRMLYNIIGYNKRVDGVNIVVDVNPRED
ncbi:MAG: primosomal protein N' [Candidatus Omnitrophica bacterium]|nr:primosomal protein N' [Candidatus Omnitrophota bacterium]